MFILAAALIVAGVALFVAAPLGIGLVGARAKSASELQAERCEHDRALAVQGLRELEFDREMGKLSDADYESMHKALEDRALTAMAAIENIRVRTTSAERRRRHRWHRCAGAAPRSHRRRYLHAAYRLGADARRASRSAAAASNRCRSSSRRRSASPTNRASVPNVESRGCVDAKFCAQCGIAIRPLGGAAAWTK